MSRARVVERRRSALASAALLSTLSLGACDHPTLVGSWVGKDEAGNQVTYTFNHDGTGTKLVDAIAQPMRYTVREGWPIVIDIAVGRDSAAARQGLVAIRWNGRMRVELGDPGGPPPLKPTSAALVLRQPGSD